MSLVFNQMRHKFFDSHFIDHKINWLKEKKRMQHYMIFVILMRNKTTLKLFVAKMHLLFEEKFV